jgi:hypothetical protein
MERFQKDDNTRFTLFKTGKQVGRALFGQARLGQLRQNVFGRFLWLPPQSEHKESAFVKDDKLSQTREVYRRLPNPVDTGG